MSGYLFLCPWFFTIFQDASFRLLSLNGHRFAIHVLILVASSSLSVFEVVVVGCEGACNSILSDNCVNLFDISNSVEHCPWMFLVLLAFDFL